MKYLMIFFILCASLFAQSNINEDTIHFVGQASAFTVGADLVNDGIFDNWSSENLLDDWEETSVTANSEISNVAAGNFHSGAGTGACNIWTDDNSATDIKQDGFLTVGTTYRLTFNLWTSSGQLAVQSYAGGTNYITGVAGTGVVVVYFVAQDEGIRFSKWGNTDNTIDNVEIVEWVGDLNAGGGCTIGSFTGTLSDYMSATGGVLFEDTTLATDDNGSARVEISADTTWGVTFQVGILVNVDFSAQLASGQDDGIYAIIAVSVDTIDIDADFADPADNAITVDIWIGGAYPDIATALNDSTLTDDLDGTNRKRYICVNVDQEVDAVTDFVAETSGGGETALREDDGSRKLIGFYDSISVVQPAGSGGDDGYRVVSDMDKGQPYYAGAYKAFHQDEGFSVINPNGKWRELNGKGNDIVILELNTSNFELRNFKVHNTVTGSTDALIQYDDAQVFNHSYVNCWFALSEVFVISDAQGSCTNGIFLDCYWDDDIVTDDINDILQFYFRNCIMNGTDKSYAFDISTINTDATYDGCLFYKAVFGMRGRDVLVVNCTFFDGTGGCLDFSGGGERAIVVNSILSPVNVTGLAFRIRSPGGSFNATSRNNIMYSATAGAVLTNPITHSQITPNPPLPVGTIEKDPLFVDYADGDFRLQTNSPALNAGLGSLFGGRSTIGAWEPYALPMQERRSRYAGTPIYK